MTKYETVVNNILDGKYKRDNLKVKNSIGKIIDTFDAHYIDNKEIVGIQYKNSINALVVHDETKYNPDTKAITLFITVNPESKENDVKEGLKRISRLSAAIGDVTLYTVADKELISTHFDYSHSKKLQDNPLYDRVWHTFNTKPVARLYGTADTVLVRPYDSDKLDDTVADHVEFISNVNYKDFADTVYNTMYPTKIIEEQKALVK